MDGTLLPDGSAPTPPRYGQQLARFAAWAAGEKDLLLVYATGRYLDYALRGMREYALPRPYAVVSNVGTEIWLANGTGYAPDAAWEDRHRAAVGEEFRRAARAAASALAWLTEQEPEKNSRFKMSYYFPAAMDESLVKESAAAAAAADGLSATIIVSRDPESGNGLLDFLPPTASKKEAIRFLMARYGLNETSCVFSGDNMNDYDLLVSGINGILVRNAAEAVKARVAHAATGRCYRASGAYGESGLFVSGIFEGLKHFGWMAEG